ncbi:MAG: hypothetical protein ACXW4Q_14355 [Anaerolineales bacterium]
MLLLQRPEHRIPNQTPPSDLTKSIAVTRDNLTAGTISDVTTGGDCKPFDALVSLGKWDDVLLYRFQCNTGDQLFELSAETYHGAGGWWKPVE